VLISNFAYTCIDKSLQKEITVIVLTRMDEAQDNCGIGIQFIHIRITKNIWIVARTYTVQLWITFKPHHRMNEERYIEACSSEQSKFKLIAGKSCRL
jgi:hypothetical protein